LDIFISKFKYFSLDTDEINTLLAMANVSLPKEPSLPFWDSIGGKIIAGFILLFIIIGMISKPSREKT
jgi:hypothetical protein